MVTRDRFSGKTAVVTGAASGIGQEVARQLFAEGAKVALLDVNASALDGARDELGDSSRVVSCIVDITKRADVERAAADVATCIGNADVVVNCAGVVRWGSVTSTTDAEWDTVLAVNLKGSWLVGSVFARHMIEFRKGAIVYVGSNAGLAGMPDLLAYSASKGGVVQLTRAMAMDLAPFGIRVNCVCPGHTKTAMGNSEAARLGLSVEEFRSRAVSEFPIGRLGEPRDIAAAILFLASDEAAFVTGAILAADGGYTAR